MRKITWVCWLHPRKWYCTICPFSHSLCVVEGLSYTLGSTHACTYVYRSMHAQGHAPMDEHAKDTHTHTYTYTIPCSMQMYSSGSRTRKGSRISEQFIQLNVYIMSCMWHNMWQNTQVQTGTNPMQCVKWGSHWLDASFFLTVIAWWTLYIPDNIIVLCVENSTCAGGAREGCGVTALCSVCSCVCAVSHN